MRHIPYAAPCHNLTGDPQKNALEASSQGVQVKQKRAAEHWSGRADGAVESSSDRRFAGHSRQQRSRFGVKRVDFGIGTVRPFVP